MRLTVDGELFEVVERADEPGAYVFTWLSGPNEGYGFHSARNDRTPLDPDALEAAIRNFLENVDPETGSIEWTGTRPGA